jgi:hypothetical protein
MRLEPYFKFTAVTLRVVGLERSRAIQSDMVACDSKSCCNRHRLQRATAKCVKTGASTGPYCGVL